jgi:hypothetical protein
VHLFWSFSVNYNIITRTHNPKRQERRRILLLGFEDHKSFDPRSSLDQILFFLPSFLARKNFLALLLQLECEEIVTPHGQ